TQAEGRTSSILPFTSRQHQARNTALPFIPSLDKQTFHFIPSSSRARHQQPPILLFSAPVATSNRAVSSFPSFPRQRAIAAVEHHNQSSRPEATQQPHHSPVIKLINSTRQPQLSSQATVLLVSTSIVIILLVSISYTTPIVTGNWVIDRGAQRQF
ncbi:unnamed protein product, partial [Linum tenue]